MKNIFQLYRWAGKFKGGSCNYKYRNKKTYNSSIGFLKVIKDKLGDFDKNNYGDNDILTAQGLYTKYLYDEKERGRTGTLNFLAFSKYLEVAVRKFVRFFPTYQNYMNVCGYKGGGRQRCKFYKNAGEQMVKPMIEKGYLLAIVENIYAGLKPEKPSWWRIDKHVTNYFHPMKRIARLVGTLRNDLKGNKCKEDIIDGMKEIYSGFVVDLPFKYAAAKSDADKMNLENDAADFFTSSHVGDENENVKKEHLAFKKIIRQLTIALNEHLKERTSSNYFDSSSMKRI